MSDVAKCELCGEPMPPGEQMFKYHGYSGPCPKPPLPIHEELRKLSREIAARVWQDQEMRNIPMDIVAAEKIASVIAEVIRTSRKV